MQYEGRVVNLIKALGILRIVLRHNPSADCLHAVKLIGG
jgi:hypothetical protein